MNEDIITTVGPYGVTGPTVSLPCLITDAPQHLVDLAIAAINTRLNTYEGREETYGIYFDDIEHSINSGAFSKEQQTILRDKVSDAKAEIYRAQCQILFTKIITGAINPVQEMEEERIKKMAMKTQNYKALANQQKYGNQSTPTQTPEEFMRSKHIAKF